MEIESDVLLMIKWSHTQPTHEEKWHPVVFMYNWYICSLGLCKLLTGQMHNFHKRTRSNVLLAECFQPPSSWYICVHPIREWEGYVLQEICKCKTRIPCFTELDLNPHIFLFVLGRKLNLSSLLLNSF